MRKSLLFCLILSRFVALAQDDCPYFSKYMEKGNAELTKGSNADFESAINAYSTAMIHCPEKAEEARKKILEVFKTIETLKTQAINAQTQVQVALKKATEEKEKARYLENLAQAESQSAKKAKALSDSLRVEAERSRIAAEEQQKYLEVILDSLGIFNSREETLKEFNSLSSIADSLFVLKHDSAYATYKHLLDLADNNPLIKVDRKLIYSRIEASKKRIDDKGFVEQSFLKSDSLMQKGGFVNYGLAFELLFQLSQRSEVTASRVNQSAVKLSTLLESYQRNKPDTISTSKDSLGVLYVLAEVYFLSKDKKNEERIINQLHKFKPYYTRQVADEKLKKYKVKTHYFFEKLEPKPSIWSQMEGQFRAREEDRLSVYMLIGPSSIINNAENIIGITNANNRSIVSRFSYGVGILNETDLFKNKGYFGNYFSIRRISWGYGIIAIASRLSQEFKDTLQYLSSQNGLINLQDLQRRDFINQTNIALDNKFTFYFFLRPKTPSYKRYYSRLLSVSIGIRAGIVSESYSQSKTYYIQNEILEKNNLKNELTNYFIRKIEMPKGTQFAAASIYTEPRFRIFPGIKLGLRYDRTILMVPLTSSPTPSVIKENKIFVRNKLNTFSLSLQFSMGDPLYRGF